MQVLFRDYDLVPLRRAVPSLANRTHLGLQNSRADRKTDSQSVGFSVNGTHLGLAKLHITHSKDETGPESGFGILINLFSFNNMAERVGFEADCKRQLKNLMRHGQHSKRT